ncbi:IS3 family transposase [Streptosporangium canum]|uniref:IS3 family transposase n=1 Tax=Streptosporangium canum TaxID=324952 RepID=UPI00339EBBC7
MRIEVLGPVRAYADDGAPIDGGTRVRAAGQAGTGRGRSGIGRFASRRPVGERPSGDSVNTALFRYIDGWYNSRRIQKGLGGLSPGEYEAARYTQQRDLPDTVSSHTELTETR